MLKELVETGRLYGYDIGYVGDGKGIVLADSESDAKQKVIEAYKKHGYGEDYNFSYLHIEKITDNPFDDAQDVLEVIE